MCIDTLGTQERERAAIVEGQRGGFDMYKMADAVGGALGAIGPKKKVVRAPQPLL